jgi:hypothetical protein
MRRKDNKNTIKAPPGNRAARTLSSCSCESPKRATRTPAACTTPSVAIHASISRTARSTSSRCRAAGPAAERVMSASVLASASAVASVSVSASVAEARRRVSSRASAACAELQALGSAAAAARARFSSTERAKGACWAAEGRATSSRPKGNASALRSSAERSDAWPTARADAENGRELMAESRTSVGAEAEASGAEARVRSGPASATRLLSSEAPRKFKRSIGVDSHRE